ncbi:type II secretion system F family protein [Arthrobacter pigmenti]
MPWPAGSTAATVIIVFLLCAAAVLLMPRSLQWRGAAGENDSADHTGDGNASPEKPRQATEGLDAAVLLELAAAMLEAGSSLEHALEVLGEVCGGQIGNSLRTVVSALRLGAEWNQAWAAARTEGSTVVLAQLQSALSFAATTGAPSSALLSAQAQQLRRRSHRKAEQRAAALGVKLVLPMGTCSLPAFVCIGVLPVLLALLPALG